MDLWKLPLRSFFFATTKIRSWSQIQTFGLLPVFQGVTLTQCAWRISCSRSLVNNICEAKLLYEVGQIFVGAVWIMTGFNHVHIKIYNKYDFLLFGMHWLPTQKLWFYISQESGNKHISKTNGLMHITPEHIDSTPSGSKLIWRWARDNSVEGAWDGNFLQGYNLHQLRVRTGCMVLVQHEFEAKFHPNIQQTLANWFLHYIIIKLGLFT